jgi:UDP-GlcNAc:undecaprenyl-phosphate/decaprenyl-phosphate GlcNAc-1-phosphate transferase
MSLNLDMQFLLTALFIVSFVFSILINYILLRFAQTLGVRNRNENEIRWNPEIKPSLGGISFYLVFLVAFIFAILLPHQQNNFNLQVVGILLAATLSFLMGLADDAFNTQPLLKFLTQIFCGLIVIISGHSINLFENEFLNYFLTVFWVVGMMNSINMLDNMDGITTIVSVLACFFVVSLNVALGNTTAYPTILSLGVLGALLGFLVYNFHPSKMFMGDTGSQFLGLYLAVMGIGHCWNTPTTVWLGSFPLSNFLVVSLVFMLPLIDTVTVIVNRIRKGNSPFIGGKDHTTHHLFFRGLSEKKISTLFFFLGSGSVLLAYLLVMHFNTVVFYFALVYFVLVFAALYLNTLIKRS